MPINFKKPKIFDYGGIGIRYWESGKGHPIIFLHGFGAPSVSWGKVIKYFPSKYKLILIDLKGFGLSDKPLDGKYSPDDQAKIILSFIQENKIKNATLIGYSFGGLIALIVCLQLLKLKKPSTIKSLILIDSVSYKPRVVSFVKMVQFPITNKFTLFIIPDSYIAKMFLKTGVFGNHKITKSMVQKYVKYAKLPGGHYTIVETAKHIIPENIDKITVKYKKIKIPTLIIWGEEDKILPVKDGQKLNKDIPNSKLIIFPKCGHIPLDEKPKKTAQEISKFLRQGHKNL